MHPSRVDTVREVATPEGCALTLRLAGPVVRARAWVIDALVRVGIMLAVFPILLSILGKLAPSLLALAAFGLEWFYPILFEVFAQGATPGKRSSNLVVLNEDGTPVAWGASLVRNTLRAVDFLPLFYGVGLATMLLGEGFQRIGDIAAGTVVVYRDEPYTLSVMDNHAEVLPLGVPLAVEEQRALIEFVRRMPSFSEERADELAAIVEPAALAGEAMSAKRRLVAIGYYLMGHR